MDTVGTERGKIDAEYDDWHELSRQSWSIRMSALISEILDALSQIKFGGSWRRVSIFDGQLKEMHIESLGVDISSTGQHSRYALMGVEGPPVAAPAR